MGSISAEKLIFAFAGLMFAVVAYAMDWQRDQDRQMSAMRSLIDQQTQLLQMQQQFQRNTVVPISSRSVYGYGSYYNENSIDNPADNKNDQ